VNARAAAEKFPSAQRADAERLDPRLLLALSDSEIDEARWERVEREADEAVDDELGGRP